MSEQAPKQTEQLNSSAENIKDAGKESQSRLREKLRKLENSAEQQGSKKERIEQARTKIEKETTAVEKHAEKAPKRGEKKRKRPVFISPAEKRASLKKTYKHIQGQMSAPARVFSKFIHNPAIEKVSEVTGKTIARSSGLIGAGASIIIGLSIAYFASRDTGFALSGFEFIFLLIVGFLIGIITEWVWKTVRKSMS